MMLDLGVALARTTPAGDLDLSEGSRRFVSGSDYIAQKIQQRLQFFQGEWWKDTTLGVPWLQDVLIKSPSLEVVRSIVKNAILAVPGISSVPTCTVDFDTQNRLASITFTAVYGTGQTVTDTVELGVS